MFAGVTRARRRVYVSDWFACAVAGTYPITHNLQSIILDVSVQFAPDDGGSPDLTAVQVVAVDYNAGTEEGAIPQELTATTLVIQAGANFVAWSLNASGNAVFYASGHYRVIVERLE